jgi:hypothetical protein
MSRRIAAAFAAAALALSLAVTTGAIGTSVAQSTTALCCRG